MSAIAQPGEPASDEDVSAAEQHANRANLSSMIAQRLFADDETWDEITNRLAEVGMPIDPRDG